MGRFACCHDQPAITLSLAAQEISHGLLSGRSGDRRKPGRALYGQARDIDQRGRMVPKPIIIRPGVIADADPVFSLLVQFATSYRPERAVFNATFPELISSPAACLLVAEDAGEVVGYALAVKTPTLYAN